MDHKNASRLRAARSASRAGRAWAALAVASVAGAQTLPPPPVSPTPVANYEYDAEGNPTKTVVAPGSRNLTTQSAYDSLSRRTSTIDAKNGLTQFGYDLLDQLTSVTDPRSLITQYQPTGLGDVKALTSPDTGTASSTYDAAGNLKTRTDARGVLATYSYDALNRPTQTAYSKTGDTTRTVKFTYDQTGTNFGYGIGRLTTLASPDVSTSLRYDALGRVTATMQNGGGRILTVAYEYDAAGRVTKMTYPSGRVYNYTRVDGHVQSISKTAGTDTAQLLGQIVTDPLGQPQKWVWTLMASSAPRAYERVHDTNGRLVRHPLGTLVRDITYDDADRVSRYTHYSASTGQPAPNVDQSFGYDELSRLISVTGATSWSYAYDANGNRTASSAGITARGYTVSATSNRLDALTNPARSMGYDPAGNTLSDVQSGSSANYTARYSLEGRLAAMKQDGVAGVDFAYDAMGRRITRSAWTGSPSNPRTLTLYAYDQDHHLIGEYKADGSPLMEYIWLGDIPVAMIKLSGAEATTYAIHTDHLNTPRVVLDAQAQVRWRWLGEPFGANPAEEQPNAALPALQQSLRFPGQQYEPFGGRHYNHFRDYEPTTGRYVQSDPIGLAGGLNTYAYVGANPLSYSDPLGLAPRKLSPDSMECRQLQDKIKRRSDFIAKYARELYENKQSLPVNPSMPGLPIRYSQLGHAERMESEMEFQKKDIEKYNEKCGCPDDDCKNGGQGANQSTPQTTPSSPSSSSPSASKVAIGAGIVVCAAACLAFPEICIPGLLLGGLATK
jgi:RHS repeat-associated protein